MRTRLAIIVLLALVTEAHAQNQADQASLRADVWERILARLEALPDRWNQLPTPALPPSGRLPEQVLDASTEAERQAADALLSRLVRTPPQERARVLTEIRDLHTLTEVVLWWPSRIARQQQLRNFDEMALTLDAWLALAEHLGRRDVLLRSAGAALDLATHYVSPTRLVTIAQRWSTLSPGPHGVHGAASVNEANGRILFGMGRNDEALDAYRRGRQLYLDSGDELGQGYAREGEARVLHRLGQNDAALQAYHEARALFVDARDKPGQGYTWEGEARVLWIAGKIDSALRSYGEARKLFLDAGDHRGQGYTWEGEAKVLHRLGQKDAALHAYRQARALFENMRDKRGQGYAWMGEARVLFHGGQNDAALKAQGKARSLFLAVGDKLGQGFTWLDDAHVQFHLGQIDDALHAYRQARDLFLEMGDKLGQGYAWFGEALVRQRLGQTDRTLEAQRQARSLLLDVGDKVGQGNTWFGEGYVLSLLGQYDGAIHAHRQARRLFLEVSDKLGQGNTWKGEADVLLNLGRFDDALHAYRQARSLFLDVGNKLGQGNSWDGEAQILSRLGLNDGALHAYRQARILFLDVGDKLGQALTWDGEAKVLSRLGLNDDALHAYRQARILYMDTNSKHGQGNTWVGEAEVLSRLGQPDGALHAYRQARNFYSDADAKMGQAVSWRGEAEVLFRLNELGPALRAAENAARLARDVESIGNELIARMSEARILLVSKQEPRAIRRAEDSLALLRRLRQTGVSDLDRTAKSDIEAPYDLLIPLLVRKRAPAVEKALTLAEEAHAPVLLDLLATGHRWPVATDEAPLIEERRRLQHQVRELDRELQDTIGPAQREKLLRERAALDAQLELNELVALGSLGSTFVNGEPLSARMRHELVREVGPVVFYYVAEEETVVFFLQPGQRTPLVRRLGLSRGLLQGEVQALRYDLANSLWKQGSRDRQRALFDKLVAPFADALTGTPRLTIIPHGPLHELPFEALLDPDDRPLFERWHVTIAPSLSVLHALRQRRAIRQPSPRENAFLGIAGGTGLSLPYREVNQAGAWFGPSARIIGQQSNSRAAYTELAQDARHILISSHGKHVAQSRSGYLELSGPDGVATRLTAGDIAHIPLRAELVTLAACETARGEAMQSDERLDLTRAFLIAGADAVLATRWRVPEHPSTRQFLLDFYQALHQGGPGGTRLRKDEALTEARRRSRARGDQAQLWATWVLVGDAR